MRQKIINRLDLPFSSARWKLCASPLDQVVKVTLRMFERVRIGFFALAPNVEIGVKARFKRQHFDIEFLFDQQTQRAFGSARPRCVWIEIDDNILRKSPQ